MPFNTWKLETYRKKENQRQKQIFTMISQGLVIQVKSSTVESLEQLSLVVNKQGQRSMKMF